MRAALLDSGPLVALFHRNDRWHGVARRILEGFRGRIVTTWPVLAETASLLNSAAERRDLIALAARIGYDIFPLGGEHWPELGWYAGKYADLDPDLADLTLLVAADRTGLRTVLTVDREFQFYRTRRGEPLQCPMLDF